MKNALFYVVTVLMVNLITCHYALMNFIHKLGGSPSFLTSFQIGESIFYPPYYFLIVYIRYHKMAPTLLNTSLGIAMAGLLGSILLIYLFKYANDNNSKHLTSKGTARWATETELKKKNLLSDPDYPKDGVIVGAWDHHGLIPMSYDDRIKLAEKLSKIPLLNRLDKWQWMKLIPGKRYYIVDNEKTHILMCAPSRSGKGIGVVIPTCLNWQESMVVADPKGENIDTCGAYREKVMGHKVIKFDPAEAGNFYRWNPINEIRWGTPNEGRDVSNIVQSLVGEGTGSDKHWVDNAKDLIIGCITHLKYKDAVYNTIHGLRPGDKGYKETCMYDVYQFMAAGMTADMDDDNDEEEDDNPNAPTGFRKVLKEELFGVKGNDEKGIPPKPGVQHFPDEGVVFEVRNPYGTSSDAPLKIRVTPERAHDVTHFTPEAMKTPHLHPVVVAKFNSFIGKPANEAGSVLSTAVTAFMIFSEKTIIDNTITSDFCLRDIRNSDTPVDLFLVTPPSDLARVGKLFRLIIELMVVTSTQKLTGDKYKCLFLIDEFPAFGKMDNLLAELGYIAGYGLKSLMIIQGLEQLKKIYKNLDLLTNCQTQVYFGPNDNDTRKHLSELLGNQTILVKQKSSPEGFLAKKNYTYIEQERPLLRPDETSTFLSDKSAMQLEGLLVLSPKNKFFLMHDLMSKIDKGHALDKKNQVGLRPQSKGGD